MSISNVRLGAGAALGAGGVALDDVALAGALGGAALGGTALGGAVLLTAGVADTLTALSPRCGDFLASKSTAEATIPSSAPAMNHLAMPSSKRVGAGLTSATLCVAIARLTGAG
jgi:hypothetical protein